MSDPIYACADCLRLTPSMDPCPHCASVRTIRLDAMPETVRKAFTTDEPLIDYRMLLVKYMALVICEESISYLGHINRHSDQPKFTEVELAKLHEIEKGLK